MSIPIYCAHTRLADPDSLKPNPANPNRHSAHQIQLLASIIQEQGWRNPITLSKRSGLIVRGHGRLEAALLIGCEVVPVDEQDYASEAEELADLLADNRLAELAELDEDELKRLIKSIQESDPTFDLELTGFMDDEIRKLFEDGDPADEIEPIPRMECQAFEHHDYLVFMFHDLRDWMQALQLMGVREVNYSITRTTKKIGIGRVLHGKRLLELCKRAAMAGTPPPEPAPGDPEPQPRKDDDQSQAVPVGHAARSRKRAE
ncbi:MAG: ParB/Srx family N-terminal domain-containing protein [Verrucomicrobiaceae bacterium]|nr:ParB/Srx family N-terminal domain-containing protein [Verrucomicrobiaceae bacterium]